SGFGMVTSSWQAAMLPPSEWHRKPTPAPRLNSTQRGNAHGSLNRCPWWKESHEFRTLARQDSRKSLQHYRSVEVRPATACGLAGGDHGIHQANNLRLAAGRSIFTERPASAEIGAGFRR